MILTPAMHGTEVYNILFTCWGWLLLAYGTTHLIFKTADGTRSGMMSEKSQYAANTSIMLDERCGMLNHARSPQYSDYYFWSQT